MLNTIFNKKLVLNFLGRLRDGKAEPFGFADAWIGQALEQRISEVSTTPHEQNFHSGMHLKNTLRFCDMRNSDTVKIKPWRPL